MNEATAPIAITPEWVAQQILRYRVSSTDEYVMQEGVERILAALQLPAQREAILTKTDRIDFLLGNGIGIECKVASSLSTVAAQLLRYAGSPSVSGLVLVTSRPHNGALPSTLLGKPLAVASLWRTGL